VHKGQLTHSASTIQLLAASATLAAALAAAVLPSLPAAAAATVPADRPSVLAGWTQPTSASYRHWDAARRHRAAWAAYGFDWTTDYCTGGPDQPAGFDFRLPCRRHDFGYRNYRAAGTLTTNRSRLDRMLYADLSRKCATYPAILRPACTTLAWTYYRAARKFGRSAPPHTDRPSTM